MWKKQLRHTVFFLLVIAGCFLAVKMYRSDDQRAIVPVSQSEQTIIRINEAVTNYQNRGEDDIALLRTTASDDTSQKVELVFKGLSDSQTTQNLINAMESNDVIASFFISGQDASEYKESLGMIANAGYVVGVVYEGNGSAVTSASVESIVSDFVRSGGTIQNEVGLWPSQVLSPQSANDELLAAAYASSMDTVVVPTKTITLADIPTSTIAKKTVDSLVRGSILCVELTAKEAGASTAVSAICSALASTDLGASSEALLQENDDSANAMIRVYTTERAVAFTFSGLGNQAELSGVLQTLKTVKGTGTFFVTLDEATRYTDEIQQILDAGQSLGIAIQPSLYSNAEAMLLQIMKTEETIRTLYTYTDDMAVRPVYGNANSLLKRACGAGGYMLASSMVNAVRTNDIRATDAEAILEDLLPEVQGMLQRGEIVHFQMNQYQKSNQLLGELIGLIAKNRNIYSLKSLTAIANNSEYTYQYPLADSSILSAVKDKIYPGQLTGDVMTAIATRYIGVDWVSSSNFLPGFTKDEIKRLDKTGLVPNDQNMVFLTFDDWGTDETITKILDVLKAHNAKATFFVVAKNVQYNPNLLRSIAIAGHNVASHTYSHFQLSDDVGTGKKFTELSNEQLDELEGELVNSYDALQAIIGDVSVGGQPALVRLFRPPTLAVSKSGLTKVFDCGYLFSVSGSYSSQDYKASSADKLASNLKKYTKSGAVLVMHMSDNSIYTAAALDIYLSEMERKYQDDPYQFVALGSVLK